MHFQTINSWIKEVRVLQRRMRDLAEVLERPAPVAADRTKSVVVKMESIINALLELDYEGKARGKIS